MKKKPRIQNDKKKATAALLKRSNPTQALHFIKQVDCLYLACKHALEKPVQYQNSANHTATHIVFLSLESDTQESIIYTSTGQTGQSTWDTAVAWLAAHVKKNGIAVAHMKADIVQSVEVVTLEAVNALLKESENGLWQKGISFDPTFRHAFLAEEIKEHGFIQPPTHGIFLLNINTYLTDRNRSQIFYLPDEVYPFTCATFRCQQDMQPHDITQPNTN